MSEKFNPDSYVGDPAFPPAEKRREEEYIERMIRRDAEYDRRDTTRPFVPEKND